MKTKLFTATIIMSLILTGCEIRIGGSSESNPDVNSKEIQEMIAKQVQEGIDAYKDEENKKKEEAAKKARQAEQAKQDAKNAKAQNVKKTKDGEYLRGNKDAAITLIEYSDFECPYCKRFHATVKSILEAYPDDVNWIYRHFPLSFHDPLATKEAEAVECVGKIAGGDKFWEFTDLLYETDKTAKGNTGENLADLAVTIGIDKTTFSDCYESGEFTQKVKTDIKEGSSAGVSGTPGSFLVHNKTGKVIMIGGALPIERIKPDIEKLLGQ